MSNTTTSPNMGLIVPTVAEDPGPDWANNLNADLGILDQHNHAAGQGVQITPLGINVNIDLAINGNNLTGIKTSNFTNLSASLPGSSPNLGCVYVAGGELYYNDEVGNVVKITTAGSVNAGAGSITGLPSGTASASYSGGTFVWQSATNTPANTDTGSVVLRNIVANSKGLTLNPPNSMGANYSLNLPSIPGSTQVLTLDTSGNISTTMTAGAADTVGTNMSSTGANAVANSRTRSTGTTVGAGGVGISGNCGLYTTASTSFVAVTNLSVTITTTGRPVMIVMTPSPGDNATITTGDPAFGFVQFRRDATDIGQYQYLQAYQGVSPMVIDPVGAGTYTYAVYARAGSGSPISVQLYQLTVYEL